MAEYAKPWLSLEQQIEQLANRGVDLGDHDRATTLLKAVGYYRLTGYLYPFRASEQYIDDEGRERTRVLNDYRPGTSCGMPRRSSTSTGSCACSSWTAWSE